MIVSNPKEPTDDFSTASLVNNNDSRRSLRFDDSRGHRFHGHASRCGTNGLCAVFDRRDRTSSLSRIHGKGRADHPGEIYRYEIDLWATSNVFKAGHRIRVYVSSSNFPRFNRNPNTGARNVHAEGMVKATQTIYHDAAHPSALVLPVVPR